MSVRRSSIALISLTVVLAALAAVVRFAVGPNHAKLPGDTDLTVHYAGKATLLDGEALRSGDTAHALRSGVPVTVDRRVRVTATHGDTAVVEDTLTTRAGGQSVPSSKTYALDRGSREGTAPPDSTAVEPSRGALSSAFPPDAARDDSYTYYDATTRSIVPVRYTGSARRQGRTVNVYRISVSAPVEDPEVLGPLPPALPKKLVAALVPDLDAPARARLTPEALSALPDPVPLAYQGRSTLVGHVDRQTGIAIDQTVDREVVATVRVGGEPVTLLPVSAVTFGITPDSSQELGDKASSAGLLLTLVTVVAPLALLVAAAVPLPFLYLRGRRRPASAASA